MLLVGIGQGEDIDTLSATRAAIVKSKLSLGDYFPSAGMVFAGHGFDHELMLQTINKEFPGILLVGCTTAGELTSDLGFSDDSVILLLFYSDEIQFSIGRGSDPKGNSEISAKLALSEAKYALEKEEKLCILFTDSFTLSANSIVETLNKNLAPGCKVFGGVSARPFGTDLPIKQFYRDKVLTDSSVMLLFAGPVEYSYSLSNTWKPIGRRATATSVKGKNVLKIDDMRAIDYYHYYLGDYSFPAPEFPLAVYEKNSEHFYLRVPGGFNEEEGSVLFAGEIPEGAEVQLTEALRNYIVDDLKDTSLNSSKSKKKFQPTLAFAFSCIMRKHLLGTRVKEEIQILERNLPENIPIFGFYTFGEIAPLENEDRSLLHNCTMVTLLIGTSTEVETTRSLPSVKESGIAVSLLSDKELNEEIKKEYRFLRMKFDRELEYRKNLENVKDFHGSILKTINQEVEAARIVIQRKNEELEKLYQQLSVEKKKSDDLLLNILPYEVAEELKERGVVEPVYYETASVLFTDFKNFTLIADKMKPSDLVRELDFYFSEFDKIIEKHGLEKLKTIGDAYMCASGLPKPSPSHAIDLVNAAWEIQEFMNRLKRTKGDAAWELRIGINSGPLMAGIVGRKKFAYDVWGDTVNLASRLESKGEPGKINVSQFTYELVRDHFLCEYRGKVPAKNKGEIDMYFVMDKIKK
ncbi:adenylate/guanylate cyclase domain-containing protein [Leptospira stimsonii]|uniref:guanylate cyclase n=1 Tax=Leptospira stimsonii TaxID=2202203 RepID=A0ABY2MZB8_9LEPT|nr:adenylate/guanylate cyclase domain-containing protein [Leptospira stimsonii]TGK17732.1 hypothetical protein EHO98_13395 [Leptospira stimsonii]TGM12575.1 hypothetical protein EHQ90_14835 [Leptospira stimsonii]